MLKTQYVKDDEKKAIKAKRGLFGYLRVFLAFAVLNTFLSIAAQLLIGVPVVNNCLSDPSSTEEECVTNARSLRLGINVIGLMAASALIANKLNRDALKRYENLEGDTQSLS
ncbi:MAG: hypothetical protein DCF21_12320 [Leptolyngbya sp.]|jgi:hypothetical protein|nr:MAG: hypothetical protein DCF21_12320 [Leptolyngbya sp.]